MLKSIVCVLASTALIIPIVLATARFDLPWWAYMLLGASMALLVCVIQKDDVDTP